LSIGEVSADAQKQILEFLEAVLAAQREAINPAGIVRAVKENRLGLLQRIMRLTRAAFLFQIFTIYSPWLYQGWINLGKKRGDHVKTAVNGSS
jgi:hypothetical protein